jgi:hypothetical protein
MEDQLVIGGLYSILANTGKYKIVKILVLDEEGVHLRLYQNAFDERPRKINVHELVLGKFGDEFSAGHLPVTDEVFTRSAPAFIAKTSITEEELEGYYMWRDNDGGYWDDVDL